MVLEANWVDGQGTIAHTVTNHPGFPRGDGVLFIENVEKQVISASPAGVGAEARRERVLSIKAEEGVITTKANQYPAKATVLATGSTMQRLGVPGEERLLGRGVSYYAKRDFKQFARKRVLVVGSGNATAKGALLAKGEATSVTVVHRRESLRAYPLMVNRLQREGIDIWYSTEVKELTGDDKVEAAIVVNHKTGDERQIAVDWIVICVGTQPDTDLAREAAIEMAGSFVKIDDRMVTNKAGVFACGEITGADRRLINAAAEGASAGMAASEYLALEKVMNGEMFEPAINGKYAGEYLAMPG